MALILIIQNISALAPVSDYHYQVLVGDGTPSKSTTIAGGTITGHRRSAGWKALVRRLLTEPTTKMIPKE